jgi:2-oxoisovalerate dehydrogenase E2 component (dihydrolipoyl transacylase)
MARYVFRLPDVGEGVAEAEIADWHVTVGSTVRENEPLVDMMTDKATVEITSPVTGTVLELHGSKGEKRPTGSALVILEVEGAGNEAATPPRKPEPETPPPAEPSAVLAAPARVAPPRHSEAPLAAPATRRRAYERGVDLQHVPGTGPAGRITPDDLQAFIDAKDQPAAKSGTARRTAVAEIPVIGLRRTIAERLQDTKRRVPHFAYVEETDMTALEELRATLNQRTAGRQPKLTVLPFLLRALAVTIPEHPAVNALFDDQAGVLRRHAALHAGIATQTPSGLMVTVLRHAEALSLWETAAEITRLSELARAGKAGKAELTGSTITITSLGAMGGLATTPIINAPEVAIIGVNKMVERPVIRGGQIVARTMMNLSSSFDHRVVDGWDAASFIQAVRERLETPATLFMDLP